MGKTKAKWPRFVSLRHKILLSLIFVSLFVTIGTAFCSYMLATNRVKNIGMRLSRQNITSESTDLSAGFSDRVKTTDNLLQLKALRSMAVMALPDHLNSRIVNIYDQEITAHVNELTKSGNAVYAGFDFVGIYFKNGYVVEHADLYELPFSDFDQCIDYYRLQGANITSGKFDLSQWHPCSIGKNAMGLTFVRFIYEPSSFQKIGVVVFGINESHIRTMYANYLSDGFIISQSGVVLSSDDSALIIGSMHPEAEMLTPSFANNKVFGNLMPYSNEQAQEQNFFYHPIQGLDAYLVIPFNYYTNMLHEEMIVYIKYMLIVGGVAIMITIFLAIVISEGMSKSIFKLMDFTKQVEKGKGKLRYEASSNDEIALLGRSMNQMLDELQKVEQQRANEMKIQQGMEIQLLQQQINPHLLYNTLDSVLWILQQNKTAEATALVISLSEFFKISLSQGREQVPLEDEIRLIQFYIRIQHLARQQKVQLDIQIPQALYAYPVYKLTLQPLVENSIVHGFSGYRDDGTVKIAAEVSEGDLLITVTDDGIGMMEEEVDYVNHALSLSERPDLFRHFGLYNINRRIQKSYGSAYGLAVKSEISAYTSIQIRLPYESDERKDTLP